MKGKVCGDFCEFTLDKGHFITGDNMSKVKVMRQPTASATLIFEFETASSEFMVKNFTDGDVYASLEKDATKEQSVLIPAQTAQRLQYGSYGGGKSNIVQIIPTATSEKGVEVQCLKW